MSIGLEITMIMVLGEYFKIFFVTVWTMLALVPINSSRVIPGFLGMPDVITTTSESAPSVAEEKEDDDALSYFAKLAQQD